jgi:hypothetical protein
MMSNQQTSNHLMKGAIISGVINAIINGIINYFMLEKSAPIYLTQDAISGNTHTVFAGAVPLAVSLAIILTCIGYFTTKKAEKPPFFPNFLVLALKHCVYAFGLVAITGLLIQRFAGQVEVSHIVAAMIAGLIAGVVGGLVDYETKKRI